MSEHPKYDAIIVGSGPNGLASAITLAQVGLSVAVFEAKETIGGGCRSMELTLPGFVHDVCSAIHALALEQPSSAAAGLLLAIPGHTVGWPLPRGGSQKIVDALAAYLRSLGGEIITGVEVKSIGALPPTSVILFDITPRQLLRIAGDYLPNSYQRQLRRYRYGPGIFKIDYALDDPIPWKAKECLRAGTVHIGGTMPEIAASERAVVQGEHPEKPFVLVAQQSLFDLSRAPGGKHSAWVYCHVPNGSTFDMTERIESQIERFAPGFRDCVLARSTMTSLEVERYNANYVGGDISGGVMDLRQYYTRPTIRPVPYTTPAKNIFICSSSTPPGAGVHGLCGYFAARAALRHLHRPYERSGDAV